MVCPTICGCLDFTANNLFGISNNGMVYVGNPYSNGLNMVFTFGFPTPVYSAINSLTFLVLPL